VCSDMVAALYSASLRPNRLRAPMKSADSPLISRKSSELRVICRFSKSRSDLVRHHTQLPTQPFCSNCLPIVESRRALRVIRSAFTQISCSRSSVRIADHGRVSPRLSGPSCLPALQVLRWAVAVSRCLRPMLPGCFVALTAGGRRSFHFPCQSRSVLGLVHLNFLRAT